MKDRLIALLVLSVAAFGQSITSGISMKSGTSLGSGTSVPAPVLVGIGVSPSTASIISGTTQAYTAAGTYSDSSTADVTSACVWSSSNTSVATIGSKGNPQIVNGVGQGSANILCTIGAIVGSGSLTVAPVVVINTTIPNGVQGTAYSVTFTATGGVAPYTFSITSGLAALNTIGLTFSSPTLSGTLSNTSAGSYPFTVHVVDSSSPQNSGDRSYTLTVTPPATNSPATLPQVWINNLECEIPVPCTAGNNCKLKYIHTDNSGDYPCTMAGLNQSMTDWVNDTDIFYDVVVDSANDPHGQCRIIGSGTGYDPVNGQFVLQAKAVGAGKPTRCYVVQSSTPPLRGFNVCGNWFDPSLSTRNLGCTTNKNYLWYLSSTNTYGAGVGATMIVGPPDVNGNGPNHIVVRDFEMFPGAGNINYFPIDFTPHVAGTGARGPLPASNPANYPTDIGIDYSYMHGDIGDNAISPTGQVKIEDFIYYTGTGWRMFNQFDQIAWAQAEGHITANTFQQSGFKDAYNWYEGGAVNEFWGGTSGAIMPSLPINTEIRKNHFGRAPNWLNPAVACVNGTNQQLADKSDLEVKFGQQFLFNGNIFENSIGGTQGTNRCGQDGQLLTFNVRNTSGGLGDNYLATIKDFTVTNNWFRHASNGILTDALSHGQGNGGGVGFGMKRTNIKNNLFYDISNVTYPSPVGGYIYKPGNGGGGSWTAASGSRTSNVTTLTLNDGGTGFHQIDTNVGDAVTIKNCTGDITINTPAGSIGPNALTGTTPNGLTLVYPNAGPDSGSLNVTGCAYVMGAGFPDTAWFTHNTAVTNYALMRDPTLLGAGSFPAYARNNAYQDNLIVANPSTNYKGWVENVNGLYEGITTEMAGWDANTLKNDHQVFLGRNPTGISCGAACTTHYAQFDGLGCASLGGPLNCPTPNGAAYPASDPNTSMWFPSLASCAGATVNNTDCIGMAGMMSGAAFLSNSSNPFTDYALVASSPYKAGGARQAHDSTDMGADLVAQQTAMSENKYSGCSSNPSDPNYCGSTGPYPDALYNVLDWMLSPLRLSQHMDGTNSESSWKSADGKYFAHIKSGTNGYPWDIRQYDNTSTNGHIYWWITDNSFALDPSAYKRYQTPVFVAPLYFTPGTTFDTGEQLGPNTISINAGGGIGHCGTETTANIGHIDGILAGPFNDINFGGAVGQPYYLRLYYRWGGTNGNSVYNNQETYYFAWPFGLVKWTHQSWNAGSGSYDPPDQTSNFTTIVNSGSPTLNFTCSNQSWWTVGAPGAGGNLVP